MSTGRFGRVAATGVVTALVPVAGREASWDTAPYVMPAKGRELGAVTVAECDGATCTGAYVAL
ncbi:hypothetical protein ACFYNZ_18140 [Streptomyces kebangsaanensis]|uniref:Uncharacterized protein n=1 Tax=Streptomyces kebangsaanensis TaxID=864058 RepID=A0ABW6KY95_9ACTN